uniref:DH domain-containing protein n=1 Tax=Schistosoma mansoni TaxID=6183 RepID=A0A5K4EUS1_SCHMA
MQRYSGQKTVSIIYDHHRNHNPSFIQQRRSFNNITIVPIEKRQRRLSFRVRYCELTFLYTNKYICTLLFFLS